MYFVTYQYASFSEAGILTADFKRVVPVTTNGKVLGIKLPEQMTDFIRLSDDALSAIFSGLEKSTTFLLRRF